MRVAAHQPGYHRHLYYFYKMAISDAFVSLDHVQFVRSDWQNRQVFVYEDARRWLTVPVQGSRGVIRSKVIAHPSVLPSHWDRIKSIYRSTPYFSTYEAALGEIYGASWKYLNDLCDALTEVARSGFGITTPTCALQTSWKTLRRLRGRCWPTWRCGQPAPCSRPAVNLSSPISPA